jgi:hypothetical protein
MSAEEEDGELEEGFELGRLGELEVEMRLVRRGWHALRLDTSQKAWNADLLAAKGLHRIALQVKTTRADNAHSHSDALGFGYSTGYLRDGKSVFNSKSGPLLADVIVGVSFSDQVSRFVVLPVAFAEKLCRMHADWWAAVPTKNGKRGDTFPIYMNFFGDKKAHREVHERSRRNLLAFENRWHLLEEQQERLHDPACWPILP